MTLPVPSFFALPAGNQPLSLMDQQFNAIAVTGILPCTATGTNALALTPGPNVYVPLSYTTGLTVAWVQPITTAAGAVTINVAGLGPITGFKNNGQTALGANDLIGGCVYIGTFSSSLASGNGGISVDVFSTGAGAAAIVSDTAPPSPTPGQLWFDSVGVLMYMWYADPTSSQWININDYGGGVGGTGGGGGGAAGTAVQGAFKNLSILVPTATTVTITADAVVTYDGTSYTTNRNISSTINAATTGANGLDQGAIQQSMWYAVWIISGTVGQAAMLSLSATTPLLPAGYTATARVGWVRASGATTTALDPTSIQGSGTLSGGNLQFNAASGIVSTVRSNIFTTSKFYFEAKVSVSQNTGSNTIGVVLQSQAAVNPGSISAVPSGMWLYRDDGYTINSGAGTGVAGFVAGDVIMVACDPSTGKLWFGKNGTWLGSGNPATGSGPQYSNVTGAAGAVLNFGGVVGTTGASIINFGAGSFTYAIPTGFTPISQPATSIIKTLQLGRRAQYVVTGTAPNTALPTIASGAQGTISSGTFVGVAIPASLVVPPTASVIRAFITNGGVNNIFVALAPNANYSGFNSGNSPPIANQYFINTIASSFMLESSSIYYAGSAAGAFAQCIGWEDNL